MAKKRKTRRQKISAASRRSVLENTIEILPSIPTAQPVSIALASSKTYTYVVEDARKTFFTIIVIAALNFILFLLLKFKYLNLLDLKF